MEIYNSEQAVQPEINFVREGVKIGLINGAIALLLMYGSYFAILSLQFNLYRNSFPT